MTNFGTHALAAVAAFILATTSIGAIVTVPPVQASAPIAELA